MITQEAKAPTRDNPFTVRLSKDERRRLEAFAATNDLRIAQVLRRLVRENLPAANESARSSDAA